MYVFPHTNKKVIANMFVLKVCFHIDTHGAQKSRRSVLPQKHGKAHVYHHENTKVARAHACVSSSLSPLSKMCSFLVSSKLKSVAVIFAQTHPRRCVCYRSSSNLEIKSKGNGLQREKRDFPKSHVDCQKHSSYTFLYYIHYFAIL